VPSVPVGATIRDTAAQAIRDADYPPGTKAPATARTTRIDVYEAADAVLVVVAPLLHAEGAADACERIKAGIEALRGGQAPNGAYYDHMTLETVLALVSREAEANE
jgi:hypothetical protein